MEEWKEYKLGEVCKSIADGDHMPPPKVNSGIPFVTISNIVDCRLDFSNTYYVPQEYYDSLDVKRKPQQGDTIYSVVGTFGKPVYIKDNKPFVFQRHIAILRPDESKIDPQFLFYTLLSPQFYRKADVMAIGAVQRTISLTSLRNATIKVPPIYIQKGVVNILKSLDDKIEVNRRINDNLEQQAQALFKSWFVDFEPFRDQPFVESELGMIPEGWKVGSFLDNIYVMPGGTPSTNVDEYWKDGTIPFFSPKDANGVYCFETEKNITELGLNNCSSRLYPKDTLFITARGTVGKIALAGVPMAMNQSNYALAAKEGVGKFYLYLLTQTLVSTLLKKANGAVFSAITTKDFNEPNLIPANNVMDSFEVIVKPIFDKIFQTSEESRRLAELRDTLLPRLMSGELSVDGLKGQSAVSPGQRPGSKEHVSNKTAL